MASATSASLGSFVPNSAVTLIHHPFTVAFTPDLERSSRGWPSHPENGFWSSWSGRVRTGKFSLGGSWFRVSMGSSARITIPSGGRPLMVSVGSPPG